MIFLRLPVKLVVVSALMATLILPQAAYLAGAPEAAAARNIPGRPGRAVSDTAPPGGETTYAAAPGQKAADQASTYAANPAGADSIAGVAVIGGAANGSAAGGSSTSKAASSAAAQADAAQPAKASTASAVPASSKASASSAASPAAASSAAAPTAPAPPASTLPPRIVAGYYGGWAAYSGYTPDKLGASKLDVVNYAFAVVGSDLKIAVGDSSVDYTNFTKLSSLKKAHPGLKTIISVGGWDGSANFSSAALTDASRAAFAQSCVSFIKAYGFDGVDIDWEYPVSGGSFGRPADKTDFTLLMKALRQALDAQGAADGRRYYLSFAGGASDSYMGNVQLSQLAGYVDFALDMTYDLHGPWDSFADLNAPLYTPAQASPQYKISDDSSIRAWLAAGFPAGKLLLGVPFYGYVYSGVSAANNGLYSGFTSAKSMSYDSIVSGYLSNSLFKRFLEPTAGVPWLYGNSTFISYDDAGSVALKAQYAVAHGLRGVSAWEIDYDKSGTLLGAAWDTIH